MTINFQRYKTSLLSILIFLLLTACGPRTTMVNGKQCIAPKLSVIPTEIPLFWNTNGERNIRRLPAREAIPKWMEPQFNWLQQKAITDVSYSIDMAVDGNFIWIAYDDFIIRYNILTKQMDRYDFEKNDTVLDISDLLITNDHILWVAGRRVSKYKDYGVLLRYDTKTESFAVVEDIDGLFPPKVNREITIYYGKDRILKESYDGNLVYVFRGAIFSYNPSTNQAAIVYRNRDMPVASIETDPRGFIWFTHSGDDRLWLLRPGSDAPESFELPEFYAGTDRNNLIYDQEGYRLHLDSQQRLWIPAWGYLDTKQEVYTWQILKPDPLFVHLYDIDYVYMWDSAYAFEAWDRSIWFTSMNGVIQYDMVTESACWISPEPGDIAETPDGVLWILLENQLYAYKPE